MAGIEQHEANDSALSLIDQLYKAVHELEAFNGASESKVHWAEIEQYFCNLEEAIVATKEQDYLERVQEMKDAAVASIAEACASFQSITADSLDAGENGDTKVSSSVGDRNSSDEDFPRKTSENTENMAADVKPRPELTHFCEQMDAKGLLNFITENQNFITENQNFINEVSRKLPLALESASRPARHAEVPVSSYWKPWLAFWSESTPVILTFLNPEIKQLAKAIADEWKPKLSNAGSVAVNDNSLEAEAFLQLLATFKIVSDTIYPYLQLSERFPPVPLLKMFLKDLRRNSQEKGGNSRAASGSQDGINARELAALKAVISCVQDYGLEADYCLDPLQKRLAQLEKAKADSKKRGGDSSKHHPRKKSRPNGGFRGFRGPPGRQAPQVYNQRAVFTGMPER
ncbi:Aspartyl protease family protein [Hibiscus syriacus]|uniref:FRIGIDA-like protein n=1 Tax=Hibiscus syriacus TaxID=106335 RepID=A0A6A3BR67_HIBSY|nr:Aspartyl protease family protein [Hibiscus syriacus]